MDTADVSSTWVQALGYVNCNPWQALGRMRNLQIGLQWAHMSHSFSPYKVDGVCVFSFVLKFVLCL